MKRLNLILIVSFAAVVTLFSGCDPVRTVSQSVVFRVVDQTGSAATKCKIAITSRKQNPLPEDWRIKETDQNGMVQFTFQVTRIDRSRGRKPAWEPLGNKIYLLRINDDGKHKEIAVKEGNSVSFQKVTCKVVTISDAQYFSNDEEIGKKDEKAFKN